MELHHIVPKYENGTDTFDNCIPLCFDCHADVGSYNPKHPKGRKFTSTELKGHRDNWYAKVAKKNSQLRKTSKLGGVVAGVLILVLIVLNIQSDTDYYVVSRVSPEMLNGDWLTYAIDGTMQVKMFFDYGVGVFFEIDECPACDEVYYTVFTGYGFYWELHNDTIDLLFTRSPWNEEVVFDHRQFGINMSLGGHRLYMGPWSYARADEVGIREQWSWQTTSELVGRWIFEDKISKSLPYNANLPAFFGSIFGEMIDFQYDGFGEFRVAGTTLGLQPLGWFTAIDDGILRIYTFETEMRFLISVDEATLTIYDRDGTIFTYRQHQN